MLIYPVPATNFVYFVAAEVINNIEIQDINGKTVFKTKCHSSNYSIDVSNWQSGIYIAKFYTKNKIFTKKFIVK
jgi:hypothetical protein